uniref:Prohormone-1 n=1 Tax=Cacopsylla melanoneura TaxID=428564 RepID=A0A8D9BI26_9HEMI
MVNAIRTAFVMFFSMLLIAMLSAHPLVKSGGPDYQTNELGDMVPESEEGIDNQMINYLVAQQLFSKLRNQMAAANDLQRKRSYWKQCAFNAVSCFGRKK